MNDDEARQAKINADMAMQRQHMARLTRELEESQRRLLQARQQHELLLKDLEELAAEEERKRQELFAMKLELEAKRRTKLRMKLPPDAEQAMALLMAEGGEFEQQRRAVRAPFVMPVHFGGLKNFYSGLAINISDGGMLVATTDPPPLHRRFAVEFELEQSAPPIRAPVESVWLRQDGEPDRAGFVVWELGLKFLSLGPQDRERVGAFSKAYSVARRR